MEFLEDLSRNINFDFNDVDNIQKLRDNIDLAELLFNGATIKTNRNKEEIESAFINPFIKSLMKKGKIWPAKEQFDLLGLQDGDDFFSAIKENVSFLLLNDTSLKKLRRFQDYHGYHCLSTDGDISVLFDEKIKTFKNDNFTDWQFAKEFMSPHNSIVVADPYLYKEATLNSLNELLVNIAPKRLKKTYHISLVGSSNKQGMDNEEYLIKNIEKLRSGLQGSMGIKLIFEYHFCNQAEFHDRYIITNNTCIFSGYGLDILNRGKTKKDGTWLAFKPFKRMNINGERGVYFCKIMNEKLNLIGSWIKKNGNATSANPLLCI